MSTVKCNLGHNPLVSVVVPSYCHSKYVVDCLSSIIAQTYENIELIIIDDCSTDGTYNIIESMREVLEKRFSRVVIKQNDINLGVVKNCNKLVELSNGMYCKLIASDDILLENAIEDLVFFLEEHEDCDMVFSNALICPESTTYPIGNYGDFKLEYERIPNLSGNVFQRLYLDNFILAPTVMLRRDVFERWGMFDEDFSIEDWEYWLRVARQGKIGYCNSITVGYRVSEQSLSHFSCDENGKRRMMNMYDNQKRILEKYEKEIGPDSRRGFRCCYIRMMQVAIDSSNYELQQIIFKELRDKKIMLNIETYLKYICYRLGVLKYIQSLKRRMGLKTYG